jgi:hypothetical protein
VVKKWEGELTDLGASSVAASLSPGKAFWRSATSFPGSGAKLRREGGRSELVIDIASGLAGKVIHSFLQLGNPILTKIPSLRPPFPNFCFMQQG